jgi:hypothetical protein
MAEETQEQSSGGSSIKNILLGLVSTITLGIGGWFTTKLTGGDDKEATPVQQAAPVINIQNNQTQQAASGGKTVIIKEKSAEPAKPAAPVKKKEGDEFKEEAPKW